VDRIIDRHCWFDLFSISRGYRAIKCRLGAHGHGRNRWGVYSLRGRGANTPVWVTTDNFLRTVPLAIAVVLFSLPALTITPRGVLWAALSGSITSGVGYVLWYAALPRLTATRAATLQLSVPVLAAIGGVTVLSEAVSLRLVISAVVILGGVGLAVSHKPTPRLNCEI
jgi:drug/metabolite transporter (DMT)-like permease